MSDRRVIVVDTETTGLGDDAAIVEVAAIDLRSGEELHFVPFVSSEQIAEAEPEALAINRYYERRLFAKMLRPQQTAEKYDDLAAMLNGNTFAGCNPAFDANLIRRQHTRMIGDMKAYPMREVWHHRLADLSAYAAGTLGLPPDELPGLAKVCELLFINNDEEHSALGDARATAACFRSLMAMHWTRRSVWAT